MRFRAPKRAIKETVSEERFTLLRGDVFEVLRTLPDNSIDSCVVDPPYGISFMGKKWDDIKLGEHPLEKTAKSAGGYGKDSATNENAYAAARVRYGRDRETSEYIQSSLMQRWHERWAQEVYRVLKPGGYLLAFGGTRTYHRLACGIEDAGFEIRDQIDYLYGSGFPKSHNVHTAVSKLLEGVKWEDLLKRVNNADQKFKRYRLKTGIAMRAESTAPVGAVLEVKLASQYVLACIAELNSSVVSPMSKARPIALENVVHSTAQSIRRASTAINLSKGLGHWYLIEFTAQESAREWLAEREPISLKAVEVLKTCVGNQRLLGSEGIDALYAALAEDLKLTILNQSKTFQSYDIYRQTDCASAMTVTITGCMVESLISFMVDTLKAEFEGQGSALKPSHEPICMARKPLGEKTLAKNVLKYGTGGLNIRGCEIHRDSEDIPGWHKSGADGSKGYQGTGTFRARQMTSDEVKNRLHGKGRWPSNTILAHLPGCELIGTGTVRGAYSSKGVLRADGFNPGKKHTGAGGRVVKKHGNADRDRGAVEV